MSFYPKLLVAIIGSKETQAGALRLFPEARPFTLEEWLMFKNPNDIMGGLADPEA